MNRTREPKLGEIELESDKQHSAEEVIKVVTTALDAVSEQSDKIKHRYSSGDIYYLLRNMLEYINAFIDGEFILKRLKKGHWRVEYLEEEIAKRKSDEQHKKEIQRTAKIIQELSGRLPPWGERKPK